MKQHYNIDTWVKENQWPPFLQSWYLDQVCGAEHWNVVVYQEEQKVLAVWFYMLKSKMLQTYISMPALVKYMGPYFTQEMSPNQARKVMDACSLMLPDSNYFYQQWNPTMLPLLSNGEIDLDYVTNSTYLWNVEPNLDALKSNLDGNYRRAIQKYNHAFTPIKDKFDAAYELLCSSLPDPAELGISKEALHRLIQELEERKMGFLSLLEYEGGPACCAVVLFDESTAYYLLAGNARIKGSVYPGVQMAWHVMERLKQQTNVTQLDFLGSSIEEIARIWRKMGATEQKYPVVETKPDLVFGLLRKLKELKSRK